MSRFISAISTCQCGRVTTTTSSTTTTSTTNNTLLGVIVGINSIVTDVKVDGVSLSTVGASFPVGQNQDTSGAPIPGNNLTVVISVTVTETGFIHMDSSDGGIQCQTLTTSGDYTFTGVVIDTISEADVVIDNTPC